jgi:multidrug efflux pump
MQLAETSIRRPVLATVLSLLVVLIGAVSFTRLSVREYPKIDEPVVTVSVRYPGASAEVIESQIAKTLEDSIAGIDAVDVITSVSRAEQAQISVRFRLEKDADSAAAEVRDRTSRVRNRLPAAIEEPVIAKVESDAFPVIWLAFSSDTLSPLQINDLVNRIVKPRLQTVTGAADVRIFGERKYAMRVWLDTDKLAAYKLTTQDAEDAIRRNNIECYLANKLRKTWAVCGYRHQNRQRFPCKNARCCAYSRRSGGRAQLCSPEWQIRYFCGRDSTSHGQSFGAV